MATPALPVSATASADAADHAALSEQLTADMFETLANYIKATVDSSVEDYHLLAELNTIAASRYATMTEKAAVHLKFLDRLKTTHAELGPQLAQIDELDANARKLQQLALHLDKYTENLGACSMPPTFVCSASDFCSLLQ
jgi:hypothetical protein